MNELGNGISASLTVYLVIWALGFPFAGILTLFGSLFSLLCLIPSIKITIILSKFKPAQESWFLGSKFHLIKKRRGSENDG